MDPLDDQSLDHGVYRMVLQPQRAHWLKSLIDETQTWLRSKSIDMDLSKDGRFSTAERTVAARHHQNSSASSFRLGMTEDGPDGRFSTTVLGVDDANEPWLMVRVANDRRRTIPSPRLARNMLDRESLRDGGYALSRGPEIIYPGTLDAFTSRLLDPSRRGGVFAMGTSEVIPPRLLSGKHDDWFRDTIGMAQVCILTPEATEEFATQVGGLRVTPGTIRTFAPGIESLEVDSGQHRHRILGTESLLETPDWRLRQLLGLFARRHVTSTPVPDPIYRWNRTFDRLRNSDVVDRLAMPQRPARPVQQSRSTDDELERIRVTLSLPDLREKTLLGLVEDATRPALDPKVLEEQRGLLETLQQRSDDLEDEVAELRMAAAEFQDEAADSADRARSAEEQLRRIRQTLSSQGIDPWSLAADTENEEISPSQPVSWESLHERRHEWENFGLLITADLQPVSKLDGIDLDGRALDAAFDALRALSGYVRARRENRHDGDFKSYLLDTPSGFPSYPANRFAHTETGYTKSSYGDERRFPVPSWVDSSGHLEMYPHLKLTKIPNKDPRIHFTESMNPDGNLVAIVGYIGEHLTNRSTSKLN
jgi:hypothetical protein